MVVLEEEFMNPETQKKTEDNAEWRRGSQISDFTDTSENRTCITGTRANRQQFCCSVLASADKHAGVRGEHGDQVLPWLAMFGQ